MSKSFVLNPANFAMQIPLYGDADPEMLGQFMNIDGALTGDFVNIDYADVDNDPEIIVHTANMLAFVRLLAGMKGVSRPTTVTATITNSTDVHIKFESGGN